MVVFLIIAVMLFGSKLPDVMRNLGKAYSQFRRGLSDFQFSIEDPSPSSSSTSSYSQSNSGAIGYEDDDDDDVAPRRSSAPRFQAPTADED